MELQLIRASEFIRLGAEGHFDLQASKSALAKIARGCHKRGITRAMLDLRAVQAAPTPRFSPQDLAALVDSFWEVGFTKDQWLAVLYTSDPHRRARLFSFICQMRGWHVRGFASFESAMLWLSQEEEDKILAPKNHGQKIPVRTATHSLKPRTML